MSTAATRQNWEGRVVDGKFPLRRWLGGSSQSDVFLTELSGEVKRPAAIKLIPTEHEQARSILSSWQLAVNLNHPHLIKIFDTGISDVAGIPQLYVVTEYAEENLGQILPERPLTPDETKEMLLPILDALQYLRARGLIHGQIKPSNLLVVDNQLKLSSDGIRKPQETSGTWRHSLFDAPEVAAGKISSAADVWSLGALLVAAMTQSIPDVKGAEDPEVPESVAEPFATITRGCLKRNPSERLSPEQIRNALDPPPIARSAEPTEATREQKKSPVMWIVAVIFSVLAIIGIARYVTHSNGGSRSAEPAQSVQPATTPAPQHEANSAPNPPAGSVKGSVLTRVPPDVLSSARRTIHGKVKVSVRLAVDSSGNVENAKLESAGPSRYFAEKALQASRRWKFQPPQTNGEAVPSKWTLHFRFSRGGTEIDPVEVAP